MQSKKGTLTENNDADFGTNVKQSGLGVDLSCADLWPALAK